jgi:hypothetical protein
MCRLLISARQGRQAQTLLQERSRKLGKIESFASVVRRRQELDGRGGVPRRQALKSRGKYDSLKRPSLELIESVGPNSRDLANEVEKLSLYLGDRKGHRAGRRRRGRHPSTNRRALSRSGDALGDRDLPRLLPHARRGALGP